jgi:hypothetical protein
MRHQEFVQELVSFVCNPNWLGKCAIRLGLEFEEYLDLLTECNVI